MKNIILALFVSFLTLNVFASEYHTDKLVDINRVDKYSIYFRDECADGYIRGEMYYGSEGRSQYCLRESMLKKEYTVYSRLGCIENYLPSYYFVNEHGLPALVCAKL